MSVNNVESNISQVNAGNYWHQNRKADDSRNEKKSALPPKEDNAVKISISKEGIENCRKKLH